MTAKKQKNVVLRKEKSGIKQTPDLKSPKSYLNCSPMWRFEKMDIEGKWSLHTADNLWELLCKLADFERMTWGEIRKQTHDKGKSSNHEILYEDLIPEAQKRAKQLNLEEHGDSVFSLRLNNKERLFGILTDGIFFIVWYDREHEICPSKK